MLTHGFEKLAEWMNSNRQPAGPMFCIYYEDPRETKPADLTSKQGFPITGEHDPDVGIVIEEMPAHKVVSVKFSGHYENSDNAWNALMEYIEKNDYAWAGAPMEIYHVSMSDTENPAEWVTEIQWPVMKKSEMEKPEQQDEMQEMNQENGEG
jgi:effector-binding domain-containing protein